MVRIVLAPAQSFTPSESQSEPAPVMSQPPTSPAEDAPRPPPALPSNGSTDGSPANVNSEATAEQAVPTTGGGGFTSPSVPPGHWPGAMMPFGMPQPGGMDMQALLGMFASYMGHPGVMAAQGFTGPPPGLQHWSNQGHSGLMPPFGGVPTGPAQVRPIVEPSGHGSGEHRKGQPGGAATNQSSGPGRPPATAAPGVIDPALLAGQATTTAVVVRSAHDGSSPGPDQLVTMTISELQAFVRRESNAVVLETLASERASRYEAKKYDAIPRVLAKAVHHDLRLLMGVSKKARRGRGRKRAYILPAPLEIGAAVRVAPDNTRLFNPEWTMDVDTPVNEELITTTVNLVISKAGHHKLSAEIVENEGFIKHAVTTYFNTLKRQYLMDHHDEAARKREKKLDADMHHSRRHRKADTLRVGITAFRRAFGESETAGIDELVLTPWQSDEDSSDGEASADEREKYRKAAGVGPRALEVRALTWRSPALLKLYIVLAVFARFVRDCEDVDMDALAEVYDVCEENSEAAEHARTKYLAKVIEAAQGWPTVYVNSWQFLERFRGPPVNARSKPRRDNKHKIYKECISQTWASQSAENARFLERAPLCPPSFTVLDLEIPMALIPEHDQRWLTTLDQALQELESSSESSSEDSTAE